MDLNLPVHDTLMAPTNKVLKLEQELCITGFLKLVKNYETDLCMT